MKDKMTAVIAVALSLLMIASVFTACSFGKKDSEESTTLSPDDSWRPGSNETYEPVEVESVELAAIVSKALGDEAADFNGDLASLDEEQLEKVKKTAREEGYVVETDENGDTVILKDGNVKVSEAPSEKAQEILSEAGVEKTTGLSREQYERVSKAAEDKGVTAVTDKQGNLTMVETSVVPTSAPVNTTDPIKTTGSGSSQTTRTTAPTTAGKTTSQTKVTVSPGGNTSASYSSQSTTIGYKVTNMARSTGNTYGAKGSSVFTANAYTSDGSVMAGNTYSSEEAASGSYSNGLVAKYKENGKKQWSDVISSDDMTMLEDVAVLTDGSIIAVGDTIGENIVSDSAYKCKGTCEGVMVKYSSSGKRQWIKIFGGSGGDIIYSVAATSDGGFIIGGKSDSADFDLKNVSSEKVKAFVAKCDANGSLQWVKAIGASKHNTVKDLAVDNAGNIFAVIETLATDGDYASLPGASNGKKYSVVEKLDAAGNKIWIKDLYETGQTNIVSVAADNEGGCVVAGSYACGKSGNGGSFSNLYNGGSAGTYDGIIVKLSQGGSFKWLLPLIGFQSDYVTDIVPVKGGYAFTGYTTSTNRDFAFTNKGDYDSFVGSVSDNGRLTVMRSFGGSASDRAMALCSNGTDTVYSCGTTYSSDGDFAECDDKSNGSVSVGFVFKYDVTTEQV